MSWRALWIMIVLVVPVAAPAAGETALTWTELPPHAPIVIAGDAGFRAPAAVSGVVAGNGTADDPFVIAGWTFVLPAMPDPTAFERLPRDPGREADRHTLPPPALTLLVTDAHVVVRGNLFLGADHPVNAALEQGPLHPRTTWPHSQARTGPAIAVYGSRNVTIEVNDFVGVDGFGRAPADEYSGAILVLDRPRALAHLVPELAEGIARPSEARIVGNAFRDGASPAIFARNATVSIEDNDLAVLAQPDDFQRAIDLARMIPPISVARNSFETQQNWAAWGSSTRPVEIEIRDFLAPGDVTIRDNLMTSSFGGRTYSLSLGVGGLREGSALRVEGNRIVDGSIAVGWVEAVGAVVRDNDVTGGYLSVSSNQPGSTVLVEDNRISRYRACLSVQGVGVRMVGNRVDECTQALSIRPEVIVEPSNLVDGVPALQLRDVEDRVVDLTGVQLGWLQVVGARNATLRGIDVGPAQAPVAIVGIAGLTIENSTFRGAGGWVTRACPDTWCETLCFPCLVGVDGANLTLRDVVIDASAGDGLFTRVRGHLDVQGIDARASRVAVNVDLRTSLDVAVDRSTFRGGADGLLIQESNPFAPPVPCLYANVTRSSFVSSGYGMRVMPRVDPGCGHVEIRASSFVGNTWGYWGRLIPGYDDVRENWWGDASGPRVWWNPDGKGDRLGSVAEEGATPWLAAPP